MLNCSSINSAEAFLNPRSTENAVAVILFSVLFCLVSVFFWLALMKLLGRKNMKVFELVLLKSVGQESLFCKLLSL